MTERSRDNPGDEWLKKKEAREGPNRIYSIHCETCAKAGRSYIVVQSEKGMSGLDAIRRTEQHNRGFLEKHKFKYY